MTKKDFEAWAIGRGFTNRAAEAAQGNRCAPANSLGKENRRYVLRESGYIKQTRMTQYCSWQTVSQHDYTDVTVCPITGKLTKKTKGD
jgi:hypothetical protein